MEITEILNSLLSKGIINYYDVDLNDINEKLRPLNFIAVISPNKDKIILKDLNNDNKVLYPWKESSVNDVKKVFELIATNKAINNMEIINKLIKFNYVVKINNRYELTERAIINFEDFLLNVENTKYRKCHFCEIITDENGHDKCKEMTKGFK